MKKKSAALILVFLMILGTAFTAFAATPQIVYESSYDGDSGLVTLTVYIKNAVGTQSGDFDIVFDKNMFEYKSSEKAQGSAMIECGLSVLKDNICTASFLFSDACTENDLDADGNLQIAEYTFKPLTENYDINDFYLHARSFEYNDEMIEEQINSQGNEEHASDLLEVLVPTVNNGNNQQNQSSDSQSASSNSGNKWYIYVIFGVVAVAAVAGIAFVAVKNSHNENSEEDKDNSADITETTDSEKQISSEDSKSEDNEDKKE